MSDKFEHRDPLEVILRTAGGVFFAVCDAVEQRRPRGPLRPCGPTRIITVAQTPPPYAAAWPMRKSLIGAKSGNCETG